MTSDGAAMPPSAPRSSGGRGRCVFTLGGGLVNLDSRSVAYETETVRLSPRAARLLEVLSKPPGIVRDRDTLLDAVWPDVIVTDESLTQAVAELRRAFRDQTRSLFETIPKRGYRLNAEIANDLAPPRHESDRFDMEGYRLCLECRDELVRGEPDLVSRCESLAERAVRAAPDFAMARARLAIARSYRWLYQRRDGMAAADFMGNAIAEAETAARLRPDLALCHAARGFALGGAGRMEDAMAALRRAFQLDPNCPETHFLATRLLLVGGDFRGAASLAERAAQLDREDYWSLYFASRAAHAFDERRSERTARACLRRVAARLAIDPLEPRARTLLVPLLARLGYVEEAHAAMADGPERAETLRIYDAMAQAILGNDRAVVALLSELGEKGWRHAEWIAAEPAFAWLRDRRAFIDVVRSLDAA